MEVLEGFIEDIKFKSEENGYTVAKLNNRNKSIVIVGTMPFISEGQHVKLTGEWKIHQKFGAQFNVKELEEIFPTSIEEIEKYLSSGIIRGIGPVTAKNIINYFGEDTLNILDNEIERLREIEGIGEKKFNIIYKSYEEQHHLKNIVLYFQQYGISYNQCLKICTKLGVNAPEIVKENPYRLADDIWGIGFKTADSIAQKMGIDKGKFVRLRSGIFYTLNKLAEAGHCYATREQLISKAGELLEVEEPELEITLDEMLRTNDVIRDQAEEQEAIYLPPYYFAESGCARRLIRLMKADAAKREDPERILSKVADASKITYDETQWLAVKTAISSKVMVLTGGPGTGKTTTTLGIISAYQQAGCKIILAAPTGRAAKRMSEAAGMEAKTIHRLLEYKPPEGYQKNEEHPIEGDVLILDECSMIDIMLMYNLLKALPEQMSLILIGDTDQLPSVGAGNVLRDIIASRRVPVVRLTQIFRQAQGSRIIMNAHRINRGESIDMRGGKESDFFFASKTTNQEVVDTIVQYCKMNLPRYYHVDPFTDIQVLTPMQRGECGAVHLNQVLQEAMNPSRVFLRRGGTQYRLKDKVMQIRNDYDKEVFNGDIGTITKVDMEERELTVLFDDREVVYDVTELEELSLAYAVTIHKAQGSEYPIVVMPFTMSHFVMLQRNLLYTGVTRAKKILVLVGEKKAVYYAIKNETTAGRNTCLARRLQENSRESKKAQFADKTSKEKMIVYKGGIQSSMICETPTVYEGDLWKRLSQSKFRSSFSLKANDRNYVSEKGMAKVREHAIDFISKRLAPANLPNDGRQTPMRGHPVFVAQHATATCCRGCLEKWHRIPKGRELTWEEQEYVVDVIMEWISREMKK